MATNSIPDPNFQMSTDKLHAYARDLLGELALQMDKAAAVAYSGAAYLNVEEHPTPHHLFDLITEELGDLVVYNRLEQVIDTLAARAGAERQA